MECGQFEQYDFDKVSNDISVARKLSRSKHVGFFKHKGACDFVIETLTFGHKPVLTGEVSPFEREAIILRAGSFCCNGDRKFLKGWEGGISKF